ncbi:MAG: flavodoxin family protein [Sulfolobales archaeon]
MSSSRESLRVAIIYSSPRTYGNSRRVSEFLAEIFRMNLVETRIFNVYEMKIEPCLGCVSDDVRLCVFPCVIEDDARELFEYLDKSHGFVIVSPIYWYSVPGPLKNLIDRMTVFENAIFTEGRSRLEGKVFGVVVVGSDTGSIAVIQNLMSIMNSMGVVIPPWALAYYAGEGDPFEDEKFLLDLGNLARSVVEMIKILRETDGYRKTWYDASSEFIERLREIAKTVNRMISESESSRMKTRLELIRRQLTKIKR